MISIVVLQTVAANLGSMLTPIGNPQSLYSPPRSAEGKGRIGTSLPLIG